MSRSIREELEKTRPSLSDQDLNQLEAELNELSNLIIDSFLSKERNGEKKI